MSNELYEFKAKKEGKVTSRELINNLVTAIEAGEVEAVVFVARGKEGIIKTGWSDVMSTEALGMLHCGQQEIIVCMYE